MAELKTKKNTANINDFLNSIDNKQRREDSQTLLTFIKEITGEEPSMWGGSIIGFGSYHYVYESGRTGDWMQVGFSPRKQALTLYIMSGFSAYPKLMEKLGKYKTGKSCLYVKKLSDIDMKVLEKLIKESIAFLKKKYPSKN